MKQINWVVAHTAAGYADLWMYVQGFETLDSARAEMHRRADAKTYKGYTLEIVAVFRNRGVDLLNSNYRYSIDLRDKSTWPIGAAVGGLVNLLNSDGSVNG